MKSLCPFCMKVHDLAFCKENDQEIPAAYTDALKKRQPVFYIFTIGYSGHGKTCFLSSLFFSLYHHVARVWNGFSFLGLNQDTLDKLHKSHVSVLEDLKLPAKTPIMFPAPLLLKAQRIPMKRDVHSRRYTQEEAVFVFYDVGGGTFDVDKKIEENLPIIKNMHTLLFLIDLPGLLRESNTASFQTCERKIHALLNVIYNTIRKLGQEKQKQLILCFTKADLMINNEPCYGPLATWLDDTFDDELPAVDNMEFYIKQLEQFSRVIEIYFAEHFPMVYNTLKNNFKAVSFCTFSALGADPAAGQLSLIEPKRILDPVFFNMLHGGYL